jgi:recombination protein RecR
MATDQLLKQLVSSLSTLPGIGKKSAIRIGFHIIRMDNENFQNFISNLQNVKDSIHFCKNCGGLTDLDICDICTSDTRNSKLVCVVEQPEDVLFIENTGEMKGKYHVLNGVISPLDGIGPDKLRIKELLNRIKQESIEEILLATNPTLEGEATASFISQSIKEFGIKVSRIANGVSIGSTIEYADQYTLGRAITSRLPF